MSLPNFTNSLWLPPGVYPVSWSDISNSFSGQIGSKRHTVFSKLEKWVSDLRTLGVKGRLILDGSFISNKPDPSDFDCVLIVASETTHLLNDPQVADLVDYQRLKIRGFGDIFYFTEDALTTGSQLLQNVHEIFARDKDTNDEKGMVELTV